MSLRRISVAEPFILAVLVLLSSAAISACSSDAKRQRNISESEKASLREVNGDTLVSKGDPSASFVFNKSFQYSGRQFIDIMDVAGAEQYFFIDAAADHSIRRFYWIQFEHYYADNNNIYDYSRIKQQPVSIGRLGFMGDIRLRKNYFTMDDRPGSDSKAAENFLRGKGFTLDGSFITLRLFHLPDETKRRELMIIYGELFTGDVAEEQMKTEITAHAQENITVR